MNTGKDIITVKATSNPFRPNLREAIISASIIPQKNAIYPLDASKFKKG